jgi:copper chaperone CopZ
MDFNSTIDLIIKDLNEASEIIDDLKKYPGVPALQVELAKSKCRSAGDVIALLKSIGDTIPVSDGSVLEKHLDQSEYKTVVAKQTASVNKTSEEKKKELNTFGIPSPPAEKKVETRDPVKKVTETSIVADKFSHTSDLYTEQTGSIKTEKDLSDHLKAKPITSLTEAIGISDKFLFMGEIFDGNKDAYTQAISRLDKAESLQDAMAIIMSYMDEKPENEAVIQLLDLVKLKLPSNE